jgi:parvulin-like peptidyl-prolyl isomerase
LSGAPYRAPARAAFTQIFFKSEAAARAAVDDLATADLREIGDPTLLARDYAPTDVGVIESAFGPEFIGTLAALEPGAWHGPIASPYGFHLVYLHQRHEGEILPFEQVRPRLVEEWRRIEQQRASELLFTRLLEKYGVVVDDGARALLDPQLAALTASTE